MKRAEAARRALWRVRRSARSAIEDPERNTVKSLKRLGVTEYPDLNIDEA